MRSGDFVKMGIKNLWRRKLRTILTIVGVVIGTFSIVIMVSLGIAMSESYKDQIMQMGSLTTINVNKYYSGNPEIMSKDVYQPPKKKELDDNLVKKISEIPHVRAVTPISYMSAKLVSGRYESWVQLKGINPSTIEYFDFPELEQGRMITENDTDEILITEYACNFYNPNQSGYRRYDNNESPVDVMKDRIQITFDMGYEENTIPTYYKFKPVGKLVQSRGDKDGVLYVNIEQLMKWKKELKRSGIKTYEEEGYSELWVSVDNIKYVEQVQDTIKAMEYGTHSLADMLKPMQETANTLQLILGGIGAVSLLVSAIGIANTMIMSIYERTKEIGVMKVMGCLVSDIKRLFLFEAGMIGLIGGIFGIGLSYLASYLLNKYGSEIGNVLGGIGTGNGSPISVIPIWLILTALAFAMLVGVVSGYYPARRATKIKALEAIRESN